MPVSTEVCSVQWAEPVGLALGTAGTFILPHVRFPGQEMVKELNFVTKNMAHSFAVMTNMPSPDRNTLRTSEEKGVR